MKWWDDLRNYFYRKSLEARIRGIKALRTLTNLNDAKTIGIIYDSTNPDNDIIITKFAEHLRGLNKTVEILGFVDDKKIDHKSDIIVFNRQNLNWARVPNDERVEKFARNKFDLLLACFTGENLPMEFVAGISQAKWRVGIYNESKTGYYDLMINTNGKNDLQYLLTQIENFLNRIKYD